MESNLPDYDSMWNYGNPSETREKFLMVLKETEGNADLSYTLQLKTQIARTYSLESKFDDAHKVLDEVQTQLNGDTPVAEVRYLLERGRTHNSANERQKAKALFEQSYHKSTEINSVNYAIDAAHMIAIAAETLEEKIEWSKKGIKEAEQSSDTSVKGWIGVFHNNMGWAFFEAKRYAEALEQFQTCWNFHQERQNKESLSIAKWSYAKTLRLLGKIDASLKIQLELLEETNGEDKSGYTYEELAELYLIKEAQEQSKMYFTKAYEILSKDVWLMKNEKARMDRMKELSGSN